MRLLLLFLVAFLPIAALTVRAPLRERDLDLQRAQAAAALRVDLAQVSHRELMNETRRYLQAISQVATATQDPARCQGLFLTLSRIIEDGWAMNRVRADGVVDCVSNRDETDSVDAYFVEHAKDIAQSDSGFLGGFRLSNAKNGPQQPLAVVYMRLVDSTGNFLGALSVRRQMRWFDNLASEIVQDSQSLTMLTDAKGFVLAARPLHGNLVGTTLIDVNGGDVAQTRFPFDGFEKRTSLDTVPRLYVNRPLMSNVTQPVYVSIGVPSQGITSAANRELLLSLLWLTLWIVLTFLCASYAAERVVFRDLSSLIAAADRLGRGDWSARSGVSPHAGELGQMANAFDRMAGQLEERQERLAQAQKMESVGQLAGGVAHDFNNLLTAIIGNSEIAREQLPADHPARGELRMVLDAARRSGQLTRQLLAFAKRNTMDVHVLKLNVLLTDINALLQRLIGEHIKLTVDCAADLHRTRIDPTQFEQLILNLAVNARDAMRDGGTLSIVCRNVRVMAGDRDAVNGVAPGEWVALTVTDTGTGMSPETVRRAFEPFYTTKGVGEGTGLGLAVVYGTVQQHGGHVRIDSAPGVGTTVSILLPPSVAAEDYVRPASPTPIRPSRGHETLLLVEDESAVRAVSARLLRNHGYTVCEAVDGADAMRQMEGDKLDAVSLLVTDVVMPHMGGPELARSLRARRPTLPVLLVSGYSETGIPQDLIQTPGTIFVEKPFTTEALLGAVRRLLDESTKRNEEVLQR
jgi:signal transduction histidine kinase/ActR/RegA family two-component response regulator